MALPLDFSPDLNKKDGIRFVKEFIRVESLPDNSKELIERKNFLRECVKKANKVKWSF